MELREYVAVLRRRWRLVMALVMLAGLVAAGVTLSAPITYRSTTTLFYTPAGAATSGPVEQRLQAYAELARTPRVADAVARRLGGTSTREQLQDSLAATASADTLLLEVSATDRTPQRAQQVAQAAATELISLAAVLEPATATGTGTPATGSTAAQRSPLAVAQQATPGESTRVSTVLRTIALSLALGLLVGVVLALVLDGFDDRVTRSRQLLDDDELATLAAVPKDKARTTVGALMLDPRGPWAEAFRRLRTRLYPVGRVGPRTIVVAGCLPETGATTVVAGLGLTLARAGARVVVVDADLCAPSLAGQFWIGEGPGLREVIEGTATLDQALKPRGDGRLNVLTAGETPSNPGELLGSPAMAALVEALEERFDAVIIDAPPVLPYADAVILGGVARCGVLLVVRHGHTRRPQVAAAVRLLEESGVTPHGAVLTMVPSGVDGGWSRRLPSRVPPDDHREIEALLAEAPPAPVVLDVRAAAEQPAAEQSGVGQSGVGQFGVGQFGVARPSSASPDPAGAGSATATADER